MSDEPAVSLGNAAEEAQRMFGTGEGEGGNRPPREPTPPPEPEPQTPEPEGEPAEEQETQYPPRTDAEAAPVDDGRQPYEIDGREVRLTKDELNYLLRIGAQSYLERQQRQIEPEAPKPTPQPEPEPQDPNSDNPYVKLLHEMKRELGEVKGKLSQTEEKQRAKEIVDDTLTAMKKHDFFKDESPDLLHEYLGEVLMLQGVNKNRGMTTQEAVAHIARRYEKKITARAEKWKQDKIRAAGQKVEGGGTTHPTRPAKPSPHALFDGSVFKHAMDYVRGKTAE